MSFHENNKLKINLKNIKSKRNEKMNIELNLKPFKTFQGEPFISDKNDRKINKKRLKSLEKSQEILKNISKRFKKQNSLFVTGLNGEVKTPFSKSDLKFHVPRIKLKSDINILKNYNVFENEDEYIRKILFKLYIQENIKKKNAKQKKRMILDKIYGFSPNHTQSLRKAKMKKFLPLKEYQDNILSTFARNCKVMDNSKFIDLIQNFREIRAETESITPLPKINIETIRNHILVKGVKNLKKMPLKQYLLKNTDSLDEFEKENLLINKLKTQRYNSYVHRNKRNRNLDILPQYLKDKFNSQIKYHG